MSVLGDLSHFTKLQQQERLFTKTNRTVPDTQGPVNTLTNQDLIFLTNFNTLPLFTEDGYVETSLFPTTNYSIYELNGEIDVTDGVYNTIKTLNYLHHRNYNNLLNTYLLAPQPLSYTQVLNAFRAGFEENTFSVDSYSDIYDYVLNTNQLNVSNDLRASNTLKLRSTAKNAINTFGAVQKVFRPRFDEGRFNLRFQDISNSFYKYPFLSEPRTPYESLLGKNRENFFVPMLYKSNLASNYSNLSSVINSLDVYFTSLPFLTSMHSDVIRHFGFD